MNPENYSLAQPEPVSTLESTTTVIPGCTLVDEGGLVPNFPIDIVYTWVNSSDERFQSEIAPYLTLESAQTLAGPARFSDHSELRYSLRSLEMYAPWVNHIYIVTNGQRPSWLSPHPKITLVAHQEIIDSQYLPTFNSHVIESALHHIYDLKEHYIYFNDDVLLLRPVAPSEFFASNGLAFEFISDNTLPEGPPLPEETATNWAAKNARNLVKRHWGYAVNRRFAHICYPQLKSVAKECERLFASEYRAFRQNKFRNPNDVFVCGYLHPAVAYITRRALFSRTAWWYVKVRDPSAAKLYKAILAEQKSPNQRIAVCLNDTPTQNSHIVHYAKDLSSFLNSYYPNPSAFEVL